MVLKGVQARFDSYKTEEDRYGVKGRLIASLSKCLLLCIYYFMGRGLTPQGECDSVC